MRASAVRDEGASALAPRPIPVSVAVLPTSALILEVNGAALRIEQCVDNALLRTLPIVLHGSCRAKWLLHAMIHSTAAYFSASAD